MSDLRDFLNWFDGFSENIEAAPSEKQWAKIKDRIKALQAAPVDAYNPRPTEAPTVAKPAAPRPKPKPPFYIDLDGMAKRSNGERIMATEVQGDLIDLRGMDGDAGAIVWKDGSTGIRGADLTIVAV